MTKHYVQVWLALLLLLAATVGVGCLPLSAALGTALSLSIAAVKAALVLLFFMHVKAAKSLTRVFVGGGLFWLGILFSLTLTDYLSRGWLPTGQ
jgi:cytochrome c oxidase subunit 4